MVFVGIFFYVFCWLLCLWAIDMVIKEDNMWFIIHSILFFMLSVSYLFWYYRREWIAEGLIFLIGGTLVHMYQSSKRESSNNFFIDNSKYLSYSLGVILLITVVIRYVF